MLRLIITVFLYLIVTDGFADNIFSDEKTNISFRYPIDWSERKPQLHTTIALLYSDNGSDATCNLNSKQFDELHNLSEEDLNKYRKSNHSKQYFIDQTTKFTPIKRIHKYWRGKLGQKDAGFLKYEYDLFFNDKSVRFIAFSGATFASSRRFVLECNSPIHGQVDTENSFNYIRNTLLFMR